MPSLPPKLRNYFTEAIVESLGYVDQNRKFEMHRPPSDDSALLKLPLTAIIRFQGERFSGALTFATNAELLKVTNPIKQIPKGQEDQYQRDWLGEIANLILGTLKRKLANHGLTFKIGTPIYGHYTETTAMILERFGESAYGDEGYAGDLWFEANGQRCCFQLGVKTSETFA